MGKSRVTPEHKHEDEIVQMLPGGTSFKRSSLRLRIIGVAVLIVIAIIAISLLFGVVDASLIAAPAMLVLLIAVLYMGYKGSINLHDAIVLEPGEYNAARFRRFEDSLEAVSIGAGVEAPNIIVVDFPVPLAYVRNSSGAAELALGRELLAADFSGSEVEGIVADLLARIIIEREFGIGGSCSSQTKDELALDRRTLDQFESVTGGKARTYVLFSILADTRAARETGQPEALKSAILKCSALSRSGKVRVRGMDDRERCMMFVEPELAGIFAPHEMSGGSLVNFRAENLDRISRGAISTG